MISSNHLRVQPSPVQYVQMSANKACHYTVAAANTFPKQPKLADLAGNNAVVSNDLINQPRCKTTRQTRPIFHPWPSSSLGTCTRNKCHVPLPSSTFPRLRSTIVGSMPIIRLCHRRRRHSWARPGQQTLRGPKHLSVLNECPHTSRMPSVNKEGHRAAVAN